MESMRKSKERDMRIRACFGHCSLSWWFDLIKGENLNRESSPNFITSEKAEGKVISLGSNERSPTISPKLR